MNPGWLEDVPAQRSWTARRLATSVGLSLGSHQSPGGLVETGWLDPAPDGLTQLVVGGAWECAFLANSQVALWHKPHPGPPGHTALASQLDRQWDDSHTGLRAGDSLVQPETHSMKLSRS